MLGPMSEISNRYRNLSDKFAATVGAVPDDRWDRPSPCPEWDARAIVEHMVGTHRMFLGFIDRELPDASSTEEDPSAAWDSARAAVQGVLDDPEQAATGFDGLMGPTTFEVAADRFLSTDLTIHRWDLATATGLDATLTDDEMDRVTQATVGLADRMRGPGAFGPEVEVPDDADGQARFLAFYGRTTG